MHRAGSGREGRGDRSRALLAAVKELAREITGAILVSIHTGGDAHAFACIAPRDLPRLRAFKTKAQLPITALTKP